MVAIVRSSANGRMFPTEIPSSTACPDHELGQPGPDHCSNHRMYDHRKRAIADACFGIRERANGGGARNQEWQRGTKEDARRDDGDPHSSSCRWR